MSNKHGDALVRESMPLVCLWSCCMINNNDLTTPVNLKTRERNAVRLFTISDDDGIQSEIGREMTELPIESRQLYHLSLVLII